MLSRLGVNPSPLTLESNSVPGFEITQHSSDLPKTNRQPFTHPCKDVTTDTVALPLSSPLWQHRRTLTYEFSISAELKKYSPSLLCSKNQDATQSPFYGKSSDGDGDTQPRLWVTALPICVLYTLRGITWWYRTGGEMFVFVFFLFSHSALRQICCIFYRCSPEALVLEQTDNSCCHRGVTHLPRLARYCWLRAAFS